MKRPVRGKYAELIAITHRVTKHRVGEGCEIGIRDMENQLVAVITHPMPRAKWFVHWAHPQGESSKNLRFGFRTKKSAFFHVHQAIRRMEDRAEELAEG